MPSTSDEPGELPGSRARRIVLGVCLVEAAALTLPATYNYCIRPMLEGLHASESQSALLRQIPSRGALVVAFVSAVLCVRVGERRLLSIGAALFAAGSVLVAVAPSLAFAVVGLLLATTAGTVVAVVGLGLLGSAVREPGDRAAAFSSYGMVSPLIMIMAPPLAAIAAESLDWRAIPGIWAGAGVGMLAAARRLLPRDAVRNTRPELWTPLLAGILLTLIVGVADRVRYDGVTAPGTIGLGIATLGVGGGLVLVHRGLRAPSLATAPLREPGAVLALSAVMLTQFANLWFYATVGLQEVYGLTMVATALALMPARLVGVGSAALTRRVLVSRGITFTGVVACGVLAGSLLLVLGLRTDSPSWLIVSVVACYGGAIAVASIAITNAVMDTAPAGLEDQTSAYRFASTSIGAALGVALMATVMFGTVQTTLHDPGGNISPEQAAAIAHGYRDETTSESLSAEYAMSGSSDDGTPEAHREGLIAGIHAVAVMSAVCTTLAGAAFVAGRRRQARRQRPVGVA